MKKYVVGFLAGALFTLSAAAFASDIPSLVGKKIQGQTVVKLDGQELDTAIIVDGKSYSPTRSIGEAAGFDVSMKDKEILLNKKTSQTATTGKGTNVEEQKAKLEERIDESIKTIEGIDIKIKAVQDVMSSSGYVDRDESSLLKFYEESKKREQSFLDDLKNELSQMKN